MHSKRDHGGGLDAAVAQFGGTRADWLDLSTGINPVPYPLPDLSPGAWTALPDHSARQRLEQAARLFWNVPEDAAVLATPGASAPIAMIPLLQKPGAVAIQGPTYNEHAASFNAHGWCVSENGEDAQVIVNPNNPDGRVWTASDLIAPLRIIDESFCDVTPAATLMAEATRPGTLILKSFGKFWGLAGLRLGFVVGEPDLVRRLGELLGPWPVAGPALEIGTAALSDPAWAAKTCARLAKDAGTLDSILTRAGAKVVGGTTLFRLYDVQGAQAWQTRLAKHHIWSRTFPYSQTWLRLGLPQPMQMQRIEEALT